MAQRCPLCGKMLMTRYTIISEGQAFHVFFLPSPIRDASYYCRGHSKHDPVFMPAEKRTPVPQAFYDAFQEGEL